METLKALGSLSLVAVLGAEDTSSFGRKRPLFPCSSGQKTNGRGVTCMHEILFASTTDCAVLQGLMLILAIGSNVSHMQNGYRDDVQLYLD